MAAAVCWLRQGCTEHRIASLTKRWLLWAHRGSVGTWEVTSYVNEVLFRFKGGGSPNSGVALDAVVECAVAHDPLGCQDLIVDPAQELRAGVAAGIRGVPDQLGPPICESTLASDGARER